jgi:hypothetical protein
MGGEGHIADMITRMKNNRELKEQRKDQQRKLNILNRKKIQYNETAQIQDVEISEENLSELKLKIKKKSKQERRIVFHETLLISILVIAFLVALIYWRFVK